MVSDFGKRIDQLPTTSVGVQLVFTEVFWYVRFSYLFTNSSGLKLCLINNAYICDIYQMFVKVVSNQSSVVSDYGKRFSEVEGVPL